MIRILESHRETLVEKIDWDFNEMQSEIERACSRSDDESKEAKAFREAVVAYSKDMKQRFDTEIRPKLKEAMELAEEMQKKEIAEAEQAIMNAEQST